MYKLTKCNSEWSTTAQTIKWVERDSSDRIKGIHDSNPKVGFTLAMDPYGNQYQTEPITEIISSEGGVIHFKIKDVEYKLFLTDYFKNIYLQFEEEITEN